MIISNNNKYYKYKYIKYKNKYINLKNNYQQNGGEVLSVISKLNLETVFFLDFEYAKNMDLIDVKSNINDNTAIEFINNYNNFVTELEQYYESESESESEGEYESEGESGYESEGEGEGEDESEYNGEGESEYNGEGESEYNGDGESGYDIESDGDNDFESNADYNYPEQEDDPINSLRQIDIKSWNPLNIKKNQYYLVKIINDENYYLLKLVNCDFKYEFINNMKNYDAEYGKLKNKKNILAPQYLFKDNDNIISGYLFNFNEGFIDLNNYFKLDDFELNEQLFLQILNKICD